MQWKLLVLWIFSHHHLSHVFTNKLVQYVICPFKLILFASLQSNFTKFLPQFPDGKCKQNNNVQREFNVPQHSQTYIHVRYRRYVAHRWEGRWITAHVHEKQTRRGEPLKVVQERVFERHPEPIVSQESKKHAGKPQTFVNRIDDDGVHHHNDQHAVQLDNTPPSSFALSPE